MEDKRVALNYICHRVNTVRDLENIPSTYGVEVDIRDHGDELILRHDPYFTPEYLAEKFEYFLMAFRHAFIILNIKSEGIEYKVLELLSRYNIRNYFFLDSSFPMINKLSKMGIKNTALRFSEYESLESILLMSDRCDWVWVDCFNYLPLDQKTFRTLREHNFKICIVSPELQGYNDRIPEFRAQLQREGIVVDLVCTKVYNVDQWLSTPST